MAKQIVNIDQIPQAQSFVRIALEKQVHQGVQHHVGRGQNAQPRVGERPGGGEQRGGIRFQVAGLRQQSMVDVDFGTALR